jgi:hypothetical protein
VMGDQQPQGAISASVSDVKWLMETTHGRP